MLLVNILFLLIISLSLAFCRVSPRIWTAVIAVVLLFFTFVFLMPIFLSMVLWTIFLCLAAFFNVQSLRSATLMPAILARFRRLLPPISQSEQAVLDAGDVWWEGDLFRGQPNWRTLRDMPKPELTGEERAFLDNQVQMLCDMLDDWKIVNEEREISPAVWAYIKAEKFLGLTIDKAYGGLGFSPLAHSHIITMISSRSSSVGISVMVPNSLGTGEFIQQYGTQAQKTHYLPKLVTGEEIPAFALTSTTAGSDAGNLPDTGVVCKGVYEEKETLGIRLNWEKRYITLAPMATLLGLAFKLYDPEGLLGKTQNMGITLCLVPTDLPGVDIGKRHYPAGLAFLNGPTCGKDVFVPLDFVIGGPDNCGKGWKILMEGLGGGRGISLPAFSTAGAKLAFRATGAYAALREQFQTSIGTFEGVMESLSRIAGLTYLCEATRYFNLVALSQHIKPALGAAISKYHMTEMVRQVVNDAMDVHGGRAIQWGPRNYLASWYQTLPIAITVEGANILTRNMIIFGQGALRCHPFVRDEIAAASDPDEAHGTLRFDILFCRHLGYSVSNFARTFMYGLTGGRICPSTLKIWGKEMPSVSQGNAPADVPAVPKGATDKKSSKLDAYCRQLTRMSTALAFVADVVTARFGGELKRKEQFSARIGDVLSQLYLASAVIKYFYDQGEPEEDMPFVAWSLERCLFAMQTAFHSLCHNLIPRWLGCMVYRIIFPWGASYCPPTDALGHQIAAVMLKNSEQRDRITEFCYIGKDKNDALGRMENALKAFEETTVLRQKVREAAQGLGVPRHVILSDQIEQVAQAGLLSESEHHTLREFAVWQADAMKVDVFN
jgi:acyl-CoA dehydrogenase